MKVISTNYDGPCCNCNVYVPNFGPDRGYAVHDGDVWKRYCKTCVPVKKEEGRRELTADGRLYVPYDKDSLDLIRSIPGAWFDRSSICWRVSLHTGDRSRLLEICDKLKIPVAEELKEVFVTQQFQHAVSSGLYPYQVEGVDWLSKGDHRLLADDMGLGKTIQTLMALPEGSAVLVISPASVKYNWKQEAEKWRPEFRSTVINGSKGFRLPAFGEIVIANYDILPDYLEPVKISPNSKAWEVKVNWPADVMKNHAKKIIMIVDEAQRVKNYKTKRSKRVKGLCMSVSKVWALTGTPLENRPQDLYGILETLQMQMKVFGGWTRFVNYMNGQKDRWGGYIWGNPKPIVPELLRRVMLRRKRENVLPDLPNKKYTYIKCALPVDLRDQMDNLWDSYKNTVVKEKELPPFEKFSEIRQKLAASRTDSVIEIVEDHEEDNIPLIVFSSHVEPLDKLAEREGWEKITGQTPAEKRQKIVNEFQSGNLKGLAVSIKAGGIGLTLTRAWKAIFIDLDWVPGANQQAEDRICRIGQTSQKVEIVRMYSDHPLDHHVMELISWKMTLIENAIEKNISVKPIVNEGESEEEFEERMRVSNYLKKANQDCDGSNKINWPQIKIDNAVPF